MVLVQVIFGVMNALYKLAANDGMSLRIIVSYRFIFATAVMIPLALVAERLEKLALRTTAGKAKVLGTVVGIGGAMVLTLYKGLPINITTHINLRPNGSNSSDATHHLLGALLAFVCCICYALWMKIS
ncbi:WAT1-related protein At1g68170-like [Hibiscus syriacus]|uniref:WAT1-related protein At1g68170-like n=1 Tax=Hibiscus syriacus TaxID=106335 RepID=UPI001923B457|nr:WAT1-related protein At1g68170-like [Hibiscus syriacus]